ncbi:hypothetical protein [Moorena sp. SIO4E2]|nr:hypothetical protein [Moorena sp. SIO4E2]
MRCKTRFPIPDSRFPIPDSLLPNLPKLLQLYLGRVLVQDI